jgi:hypothetical protein
MKRLRHAIATWLHSFAKAIDTPEARAAFEKALDQIAKDAADTALKGVTGGA